MKSEITEQTERKQEIITIRGQKILVESPGIEFYIVKLPQAIEKLGNDVAQLDPIYQNLKNNTDIQLASSLRILAKIGDPLFDLFLYILNAPIKYGNVINPQLDPKPLFIAEWIHTFSISEAKTLLKAVLSVLDVKELTDFFAGAKTQLAELSLEKYLSATQMPKK
jgi:hypothetical protein